MSLKQFTAQDLLADVWFPQIVWKAHLDDVDVESIKNYAYTLKENDRGRKVSNIGGWQSHDLKKSECTSIDDFIEKLDFAIADLSGRVGLPASECLSIWINVNTPNSFNITHNHTNSIFSGVFYIEATKDQGNIVFERNDDAQYFIPPVQGMPQTAYNSFATEYPPLTGNLYLFGGWVKHWVRPNETDRDRISISFNWGLPSSLR
jgi:uncharacterized protein (TIGR02466 family)